MNRLFTDEMSDRLAPGLLQSSLEFGESDAGSSIVSFRLKQRGRCLVLRFPSDAKRYFAWFREASSGLTRCCDYAVLVDTGPVLRVLLLELKSGKGTQPKSLQQLDGGLLVVQYLARNTARHAERPLPTIDARGVVVGGSAPMELTPRSPPVFKPRKVADLAYGVLFTGRPDQYSLERFFER